MPRRHVLGSELPRPIDQRAELQLFIARHAWIRGASGFVFLGKIIDHLLLKIVCFIHQVIRNAQLVRDAPRVHHRLRSAALILRPGDAILRPKLERDADHLVALFEQKRSGSGRIDSSAHSHNHSGFALRHCASR